VEEEGERPGLLDVGEGKRRDSRRGGSLVLLEKGVKEVGRNEEERREGRDLKKRKKTISSRTKNGPLGGVWIEVDLARKKRGGTQGTRS